MSWELCWHFFFSSYCTRVLFKDTIEDWICETCTSCTDIASPVSLGCGRKEDSQNCSDALRHESHDALIISDDLRGPHHSKRQHAVKSGKVKFLTAEEVIRLSSGTTKKEPSSRSNFRCTTSHSYVTSKISPTRVPPNPPRIIPSCPIKPYGHGRMQTSSTTNNQQSPRTSKGDKCFLFIYFLHRTFCVNGWKDNDLENLRQSACKLFLVLQTILGSNLISFSFFFSIYRKELLPRYCSYKFWCWRERPAEYSA